MAPPGRPIVAIAADGSSRQTYATARKAAEVTGVPHATIARGAKSLAKHGAFFFKFDGDSREPVFEQGPTITAEDRARAQALFHSLSGKDGKLITELRLSDCFVNATKMCQSATLAEGVEKKFTNFYSLQGTSNYIKALSRRLGVLPRLLVDLGSGGQPTFVHPELALYLASWISSKFAAEVTGWLARARKELPGLDAEVHAALFNLEADEHTKSPEAVVRNKLAAELCAQTEVECEHGFVDIVSPCEIIEVKHFRQYKHAVGQVLAYGLSFEKKRKRIHLFSTVKDVDDPTGITDTIDKARRLCQSLNIDVSFVGKVTDDTSNEDYVPRKRHTESDNGTNPNKERPAKAVHNTIEKYIVAIQSGGVMNAPIRTPYGGNAAHVGDFAACVHPLGPASVANDPTQETADNGRSDRSFGDPRM
ncbi:hypothetical protein KFL_013530040 [Klebsormidium nitens]|uniref:KilA-N domain-containing protein n=1 Tax=Klebsormidium nitens TaxID=105231 RepID=A0A1Y1IR73_KLENI|nr:hypothetical protein KFL_013530040 [Klebsormidium nitens]|eukprot:GAQ93194.1 hypothetical protein KFL_013530040 [Klebsormidium nitens]